MSRAQRQRSWIISCAGREDVAGDEAAAAAARKLATHWRTRLLRGAVSVPGERVLSGRRLRNVPRRCRRLRESRMYYQQVGGGGGRLYLLTRVRNGYVYSDCGGGGGLRWGFLGIRGCWKVGHGLRGRLFRGGREWCFSLFMRVL